MYKHVLTVYGEDLNNANTPAVVKAQGNMGGLVVRAIAIADASSVESTTITVKAGETKETATEEIGEFTVASASAVKAGDVIGELTLPWDVAKYVTATYSTSNTNLRTTLGYLPR